MEPLSQLGKGGCPKSSGCESLSVIYEKEGEEKPGGRKERQENRGGFAPPWRGGPKEREEKKTKQHRTGLY